jgi:hypothetical protein
MEIMLKVDKLNPIKLPEALLVANSNTLIACHNRHQQCAELRAKVEEKPDRSNTRVVTFGIIFPMSELAWLHRNYPRVYSTQVSSQAEDSESPSWESSPISIRRKLTDRT